MEMDVASAEKSTVRQPWEWVGLDCHDKILAGREVTQSCTASLRYKNHFNTEL